MTRQSSRHGGAAVSSAYHVANVNIKTKQSESISKPNKANPCHAWLSYTLRRRVAIVQKSEANRKPQESLSVEVDISSFAGSRHGPLDRSRPVWSDVKAWLWPGILVGVTPIPSVQHHPELKGIARGKGAKKPVACWATRADAHILDVLLSGVIRANTFPRRRRHAEQQIRRRPADR